MFIGFRRKFWLDKKKKKEVTEKKLNVFDLYGR